MIPDDDRLDAIEQRASAAIRGPWAWFGNVASHQIYLGTNHSGRLIILTPGKVQSEYVYKHDAEQAWELGQARKVVPELCGAHGDEFTPARPQDCRCDEIREFLRGDLEIEEGSRHLFDAEHRYWWLSRHMKIETELRFQGHKPDGSPDVLLHSYKDRDMARYDVLDGKTLAEYVDGGGDPRHLYREDIVGLASPEAEFIAHAREDVDYLLKHIAHLEEQLADAAT